MLDTETQLNKKAKINGYSWSNTILGHRFKKLKMSTESDSYVSSRFISHLEFGWDVSQKRFAIVS